MLLHRHQHVARIDLAEIHEGERVFVLVHHARGNLPRHDPAEHAVAHARLPVLGSRAGYLKERAVLKPQRAERAAPDAAAVEPGDAARQAAGRAATSGRKRSCASSGGRVSIPAAGSPAAARALRLEVHAARPVAEAHARHRVDDHAQAVPARRAHRPSASGLLPYMCFRKSR